MRRYLSLILIFTMIAWLPLHSEAKRRRKHRAKRAAIINEKKLYERIGGSAKLALIVDEWMRLNLADHRISPLFSRVTSQPERLGKLRRNLNDQLCEIADGPCQYKGAEMGKVHEKLAIDEEKFLAFSDNLFKSMQKLSIHEREKNEMLARIGEMRSDVMHEPQGAGDED